MRWAGIRGADDVTRSGSVRLVRWPADEAWRDELAAQVVPRLLLVDPGVTPPRLDPEEDWIRLPADERDVAARLERLAALHDRRQHRARLLDMALHHRGPCPLPDDDVVLLRVLIARLGELVTGDDLVAALGAGAGGGPGPAVTRVVALRPNFAAAGLVLHTIPGRGVVLAPRDESAQG